MAYNPILYEGRQSPKNKVGQTRRIFFFFLEVQPASAIASSLGFPVSVTACNGVINEKNPTT